MVSGCDDHFAEVLFPLTQFSPGANTFSMVAHPHPLAALSLSPSATELVSAGHDASLRFWNLETRSPYQVITSHRPMKGEGVCSVVWSQDGRWVVSGGGDGVVKVFSREFAGEGPARSGGGGGREAIRGGAGKDVGRMNDEDGMGPPTAVEATGTGEDSWKF